MIDSRTVSREIGLIISQTSKGNLHRRTCNESLALVSSLTSALDGGAIPRDRETHYPLFRRLGGPQGRSGRLRKFSLPPGFDPRTCPARSKSGLIINVVNTVR